MNNENHNNGRGIFYGVIGVATLVVAIIGATFAYFTASQSSGENDITGNAAAISFGLRVERAENNDTAGLIPMSNSMVQQAVSRTGKTGATAADVCKDDTGNSVCQVYKITLTNTSTATLFLDGYIHLKDGLGDAQKGADDAASNTTMRWAQVFVSGDVFTTAGNSTVGADTTIALASLDDAGTDKDGKNLGNVYTDGTTTGTKLGVTGTATFNGSSDAIDVINANYIRTSHDKAGTNWSRTADLTNALVFNQKIAPNGTQEIYFVVWLTENGLNQNPAAATETNNPADNFFTGTVDFLSASGGEVSATFSGYSRVAAQTTTPATEPTNP